MKSFWILHIFLKKLELTEFAKGFDIRFMRKKEIKVIPRIF